jgi:inner membrane protein
MMPSSVGHSVVGYVLYRATASPAGPRQWQSMAFCIFAANAPDLDFLPGLVLGDLSRFHHGPSHSIGFSGLFGLAASVFVSRRLYAFVLGFSLYLSHVVLDYLIRDPSPPYGVPLFWPFSPEYYMAPFAFFLPFGYMASSAGDFVSALFTFNNLVAVATEIVLLSPLVIFVFIWQRSYHRRDKPAL